MTSMFFFKFKKEKFATNTGVGSEHVGAFRFSLGKCIREEAAGLRLHSSLMPKENLKSSRIDKILTFWHCPTVPIVRGKGLMSK